MPALADPQLTTWSTSRSSTYARVYQTTSARSAGTSVTTWGSGSTTVQSEPSYADIQGIWYSSSWVYVNCAGLASYIMGPWLNPQGGQFMFWPENLQVLRRFPRTPAAKSGNKDTTSSGVSGLWVNGVAVFNALDGHVWDGNNISGSAQTNSLSAYWFRNAPVGEGFNFDGGNGHQPPTAIYHTHQDPLALRYQLGDHVTYNTSTKLYSETSGSATAHSPVLGWADDGYPIYGPYGYSTATDATSGLRRMVSGYVVRNGSNGTDSVARNLSTIPAWYARFRQKLGATYSTTATTSRASVSGSYTLGYFAQDYDYLGDLVKSGTAPYQQGVDFDLDEYNGRYCVTPEYPGGTYAYFVDIDASGNSVYPYTFGYEFYGASTGGTLSAITEQVTTCFQGGPSLVETMSTPVVSASSGDVTLTWTSVEGGSYELDTSPDLNNWAILTGTINAASNSTATSSTDHATARTSSKAVYRVTRTALATYQSHLPMKALLSQPFSLPRAERCWPAPRGPMAAPIRHGPTRRTGAMARRWSTTPIAM